MSKAWKYVWLFLWFQGLTVAFVVSLYDLWRGVALVALSMICFVNYMALKRKEGTR